MASPAYAVAYAAGGGWDQATVMYVVSYLNTGKIPEGASAQAVDAINEIGTMGLSSTGVDQLRTYLSTGKPPADLSYEDESAQVLGTAAPAGADAAPAAAAPSAPAAPAAGPAPEQQSARADLDALLDQWGLKGLGSKIWEAYLGGTPASALPQLVRGTDEYKQRFAGMDALQQKGRAISEGEYISLERSYTQVLRAAGLPQGFYDAPDDFSRLIGGEVSVAELADRVQTYTRVALQAPEEVRSELQRLYGIGPGELTAYFIDPDKALPLLQKQAAAAEISGSAVRTGFGGLSRSEAETVAGSGTNAQQAEQGFGALVDARELFTSLDAGEEGIGRGTQLGAVFGGNARAREEIEKRRARRKAQFAGGGGFAADKEGFSGLGSAG
jgi:hypothetical protein